MRPLPESPYEQIISRICEEFPAYTVESAQAAWEEDPVTIGRILQYRAFVAAKAHIERAKDWSELKLTDSVRTYMQIEAEVMMDEHERIQREARK